MAGLVKRIEDPKKRALFDAAILRSYATLEASVMAEAVENVGEEPKCLSWDKWHPVYVSILDNFVADLGLPGDIRKAGPIINRTPHAETE